MTKEHSDNLGETGGTRPGSLVERAAKKIVVNRVGPLPQEGKSDITAHLELPDMPRQTIEESLGNPESAETRAHGSEAPVALDGHKRLSKSVKIDYSKLESRNILTPRSKRNRSVEEFRLIKRRVLSRRHAHGNILGNTIMVTSALPEEGKTTISINLAMSIAAEEDVRVLLVDADFVKPDALRRLGVSAEKGLIDVIHDPSVDIADVLLRTDIEKLSLIPSGKLHHRCTELLASARMNEIIVELASRYEDRILIFDSPPILATSEAVALAAHMGQIVFVVQADRTRRQLVESALDLIGDRENVGLVLNRATPGIGNVEFGYYGSYYHRHGAEQTSQPNNGS